MTACGNAAPAHRVQAPRVVARGATCGGHAGVGPHGRASTYTERFPAYRVPVRLPAPPCSKDLELFPGAVSFMSCSWSDVLWSHFFTWHVCQVLLVVCADMPTLSQAMDLAADRLKIGQHHPNEAVWSASSHYSHQFRAFDGSTSAAKAPRAKVVSTPQGKTLTLQGDAPGQAVFDATSSYSAAYAQKPLATGPVVAGKKGVDHPAVRFEGISTYDAQFLGHQAEKDGPDQMVACGNTPHGQATFVASSEYQAQFDGVPGTAAQVCSPAQRPTDSC